MRILAEFGFRAAALTLLLLPSALSAADVHSDQFQVGFGIADITPELKEGQPIWLAGKDLGRAATGVHDKLYARAVVLRDGDRKIALVSVDSIGLPYPVVLAARAGLKDFTYVLVASTHSHESPDVIGVWGEKPGVSGVIPSYIRLVEAKIVEAVKQADKAAVPARAEYGTAEDESLLGDFRLPEVYDGVIRVLRFTRLSDGKAAGIVVQWNSHGVEADKNSLVSRDFMGSTVEALEQRHHCPAIYFQGAVGGLMGTPKKLVALAKAGKILGDTFGFIDACGAAIADLADKALQDAQPIKLVPLNVYTREIAIPLENPRFQAGLAAGVLSRPVYVWTGDLNQWGEEAAPTESKKKLAMVSEVAFLRLGELDVAAIPGELYPECVYGKYQEPADAGADFPDAPLEKPVSKILPSKKILVLGLANDELGYIVPKRQWDVVPPFAYGRKSAQYGEVNSVGPETAGLLLKALEARVSDAK